MRSRILSIALFLCSVCIQSLGAAKCLGEADTLKWNRTLNFDNQLLTLKLVVTDEAAHWVMNNLFEILARERLGYKQIEFTRHSPLPTVRKAIDMLRCGDKKCTILPNSHLNLLLWTPIGVDVGWESPAKFVSDLGLLGPVRQWRLTTQDEFDRCQSQSVGLLPFCDSNNSDVLSALIERELLRRNSNSSPSPLRKHPLKIYKMYTNGTALITHSFSVPDPPLCQGDPSHGGRDNYLCRTETFQATKLAWANLSSASPSLFQLASRMYLSTEEFTELLQQVKQSIESLDTNQRTAVNLQSIYRENACRWLRRNPVKWKKWTEGWNQKRNLTIAGLFSLHDKWDLPSFQEAADVAIGFLNENRYYFRHSEYALRLDLRNLSCESGMVLSEYFDVLANARRTQLVGSLAAVCPDSMEAMVELGNMKRNLIISPTVTTARFLEQQHFPYFFRTVPAMTEANFVLLRLFYIWNWRRVAVFRKRDHYFNTDFFQAKNIEIIADIQEDENQLTYDKVLNTLFHLRQRNSRIFIVEYDTFGTYLTLCAAYHLGMHARAGHVWFLNPWLSINWWTQPSLTSLGYCSREEMANITSWTFTVGHQWLLPPMLHIPFWPPSPRPSLSLNNSDPPTRTRTKRQVDASSKRDTGPINSDGVDPIIFYFTYTVDAVMTLATALVNLLKQNPSAISALDQPAVADTFRRWVSRTEFGHASRMFGNGMSTAEADYFGFGLHGAGMFYGVPRENEPNVTSFLRFNSFNERVANHWLLKQHLNNTTVPIYVWVAKGSNESADAQSVSITDLPKEIISGQGADLLIKFNRFESQMEMTLRDNVTWITPDGPPDDGSVDPNEHCSFPFLSQTLGMGCTGATVFVAIMLAVLSLIPIALASLHFRRKLREAEKRTRKPFEELCTELADLDMPVETIVLNRQIGQGAFGLVFAGEAKNGGCWEAVAVKVINEKATYEGKIDFLSEAKLMRSLKHRNVVRLIGISLGQKENLYLVMELMLLGDLKTYLLSRRILAQRSPDHEDVRPTTLTQMSIDIAQGLSYLHSKQLIHRDIACRNCLVGSDHVVKIGDFGLTREATKNKPDCYYRFTRNCELPIRWMSPEAVQYGIFSIQSDVWSYGITLYEIVTFGVFPYSEMGDVEVVERVKRMEFSIADFLPPTAQNTIIWQLIRQCCQHQWKNRPTSMGQVLQVLQDYPECVRPFLTDEPPKAIGTADQVALHPFTGPCFVPESERVQMHDGFPVGTMNAVHSLPAVLMHQLSSSRPLSLCPSGQHSCQFGDVSLHDLHTPDSAARSGDSLGSLNSGDFPTDERTPLTSVYAPNHVFSNDAELTLRRCSSNEEVLVDPETRPRFRLATNPEV